MAEINLRFDGNKYKIKSFECEGKEIAYREFRDISYIQHPVDDIQKLNIFVPEAYYAKESINGYNISTAPIFMPNSVGGYMEGPAQTPGLDFLQKPNVISKALAHGYVVVSAGIRGWNSKITGADEKDYYTGKAPAMIVDAKAVVRYIKYNADLIPGDAQRIISSGTSAGGTLSALMGTAGNDGMYENYLAELGAAPGKDDIFASNCYCATLDLEDSDMAYEWLFYGINDYHFLKVEFVEGSIKAEVIHGEMNEYERELSLLLSSMYPEYLNSLKLTDSEGKPLTLNEAGEGSFKDYMKKCVIESAQRSLDTGEVAPDLGRMGGEFLKASQADWLKIEEGKVVDIDWDGYLHFITRMKCAPAFDKLLAETVEGETFGTSSGERRHFTEFTAQRGSMQKAPEDIIRMMNPVKLILDEKSDVVKYWRIRHGSLDRDTSLAVPVMFSLLLKNRGLDVDFHIPWGRPHGGDYDSPELFQWIDSICLL